MKRKTIAFILLLALVLPMIGCDKAPAVTVPIATGKPNTTEISTKPTSGQPTGPTEPEVTVTVQHFPETVENPDNLPILKWVCLTEKGALYSREQLVWNEEPVHELNRMLADRNMAFRIQFVILTANRWPEFSEWFSRPEAQEALKEADLVWGLLSENEREDYLYPITEYVTGDAEPTLKNAVLHALDWTSVQKNGRIYGIPTNWVQVQSTGWHVTASAMTKYGLTEEDFSRDFWEMDEVFAKIYEKNGNQAFLNITSDGATQAVFGDGRLGFTLPSAILSMLLNTDQFIGSSFAIDHSGETPTVVETLAADRTRRIWEAVLRYKDAGYCVKHENGDRFTRGEIYYGGTVGNSVYTEVITDETDLEKEYVCIPVTSVTYEYFTGQVTGVAARSQHKQEAISLLNLIGEDEEFRQQLLYGKEGRDYKMEDRKFNIIYREDGSFYNLDFLSIYNRFGGSLENEENQLIAYEGKTKLQSYQEQLDSVSIIFPPIRFDYSGFEEELAEMDEVFKEYFNYFTNTKESGNPGKPGYKPRMTEELYDQMLQKLRDIGCEELRQELQRQLDEWLAANPGWPAQYG